MKPKINDAMAGILASAKALHRVGALETGELAKIKKITARNAPKFRTTVVKLTGENIKSLREANNVSQVVFAELLNTKVSTLQKWESGDNAPKGASLKLLNIVKEKGLAILTH